MEYYLDITKHKELSTEKSNIMLVKTAEMVQRTLIVPWIPKNIR